MEQHIGMHDEENGWAEHEEAEERQVHTEEWQLDRALQEKVAVGHAADGDEKVEEDKEIAKPQARAATRCLVPRCAGVIYAKLQREGLWDKFYMDVPARQRQYVGHCNIVKRA
jgi:hypothetical protein